MFRFVKKAASKATASTLNKTAKVLNTEEIKDNATSAIATAKAFGPLARAPTAAKRSPMQWPGVV